MKQKFIEWFTNNNNGCSPAMEDDRSFVREKTQHMFEAYQAGVAEGEARCAALAAENAGARNAVQVFCDVVGANTDAICEEVGQDGVRAILAAMSATGNMPATDAFLAEVRAQGVDALAKTLEGLVAVSVTRSYITEFAAQLRKGVQS
ncbi:TPA: ead/Ea22-like family protein [Enterobacter hormaechei]|uniref:ead/Ea22-like family protein n=1 Tax=Enterobacter hormaechei TaxID=158836 RepID=UPI003204A50F